MGILLPIFQENYAILEKSFALARSFMPKGLQQVDLFSAQGAFAWPFLHPFTLILTVLLVCIPATAMPAGERARGGLDWILAAPVSRSRLLRAVSLFTLLCAASMGAAPLLGSFLGSLLCGATAGLPWGTYALVALNLTGLGAFFGGLALLFSAAAKDRTSALLPYGGCVVVFLLVDLLGGLWPRGLWLRRLSPFGYHDPYGALKSLGGLAVDSLILFGAASVLAAVAFRLEDRRSRA